MKIGIVTANYDRHDIFRLWCASIKRLRDSFGDIPVVVTSESMDRATCKTYNIEHISCKNRPVSRKFNFSMEAMRDKDVDYVMVLGSDDIITDGLFQTILNEVESGIDVIGTDSIYYYSLNRYTCPHKLIKLKYKRMLGVAKTISRSVLERVYFAPWSWDRDHGLDANLSNNIREHVRTTSFVDGMVVDVKSKFNMNPFSLWNKKPHEDIPEDEFIKELSREEQVIIWQIKDKIRL